MRVLNDVPRGTLVLPPTIPSAYDLRKDFLCVLPSVVGVYRNYTDATGT